MNNMKNILIPDSILRISLRRVILFLCILIETALSDVVRLPNRNLVNSFPMRGAAVIEQSTFAEFVIKNANIMPAPQNALFDLKINWQMLGYAAFFPAGKDNVQLYLAQKRPFTTEVPSNAPGKPPNFMNLFRYDPSMHTERQLVIAALEQAVYFVRENVDILEILNEISKNAFQDISTLKGDLHIYTIQNPCQNFVPDNGYFSCISYYNSLANFVPTLNLHIYFPRKNMRLNRDFFKNNFDAANRLCHFIQRNLTPKFQINAGWLQSNRQGSWKNLVQQTGNVWDVQTALSNGNFFILVTQINNAIAQMHFNNIQLDELFNIVHNSFDIVNITYHPI